MTNDISFRGINHEGSDHDNHDGEMDILMNLQPASGSLRVKRAPTTAMPDDDAERAAWSQRTGTTVNSVLHVGDMTCLVCDADIIYAITTGASAGEEPQEVLFRRSDLAYDIEVCQDQQEQCPIATPLTDTLLKHLQQPSSLVSGQQATVSRLFPYESSSLTAMTGTTVALAAIESAIDQRLDTLNGSWHKHVCFGAAALRLYDGTLLHVSNIFALMPAELTRTIVTDVEQRQLHSTTYLHTHQVRVTMRRTWPADILKQLVRSIDIYLTPPVSLTSLTATDELVCDNDGMAIRITYSPASDSFLRQLTERLPFHHALSINPADFGTYVTVPRAVPTGATLSLADLRRQSLGATASASYENRLCLGQVQATLPSPFIPAVSYRYHTLTASERLSLSDEERDAALRAERLCGLRADISDRAEGTMADVVTLVTLSVNGQSVTLRFRQDIPYPIAGLWMYPDRRAYSMQLFIHLSQQGADRYWHRSVRLQPSPAGDYSVGVWSGSSGHGTGQGVLASLLWQQVRNVVYDPSTGSYRESQRLFDEIDAETFLAAAQPATNSTVKMQNLLLTSEPLRALDFDMSKGVIAGNGAITSFSTNTRRFSGVQFGAYPLFVFTTEGLWAMQPGTDGRWRSKYLVSQTTTTMPRNIVEAGDSVVFWADEGLMSASGNRLTCLWQGRPVPLCTLTARLPHFDDIIQSVFAPQVSSTIEEACQTAAATGALTMAGQDVYCQVNECLWLVYSLREGLWGGVLHTTEQDADGYTPVLALTRPLHLGDGHLRKRIRAWMCCGMYRGSFTPQGSRLCLAVWGSNDLLRWYLTGTSKTHLLTGLRGTPFRHYRVMVAGWMRDDESLRGVRAREN